MKSTVEIYIEMAVYMFFFVIGIDALSEDEPSRAMLGAVMILAILFKILWLRLNRQWNRQRVSDE